MVEPWMLPALDDAAARLTAALVAQRGHTTPGAAVAMFREVRTLVVAEPPAAPPV